MIVLETLTEEQTAKLQDAQDKVTITMLEWLAYGEEKQLNDTFKLYHYCEDDIVVIGFTDDDVEDWEVLQIQWDKETELIVFEAL